MRLANELDEIHRLGGEVVAVVVDSPERNRAFAARWGLPFPIHTDPGGVDYLLALDLWNPNERGGIARPAVLLLSPDGTLAYQYRSRDFADRISDAPLLAALAALDLPPVAVPSPWISDAPALDHPGALRTDAFGPYFRGIRFGTIGLAGRMIDAADRTEALAMSEMAASFLDAWQTRRSLLQGGRVEA